MVVGSWNTPPDEEIIKNLRSLLDIPCTSVHKVETSSKVWLTLRIRASERIRGYVNRLQTVDHWTFLGNCKPFVLTGSVRVRSKSLVSRKETPRKPCRKEYAGQGRLPIMVESPESKCAIKAQETISHKGSTLFFNKKRDETWPKVFPLSNS